MVVLVQKIWIFGRFVKKKKNIDFSHQTGHISAPDEARTSNESSLKRSDYDCSRGFNSFSIPWLYNFVSVGFVWMSAMRARRTYICQLTMSRCIHDTVVVVNSEGGERCVDFLKNRFFINDFPIRVFLLTFV